MFTCEDRSIYFKWLYSCFSHILVKWQHEPFRRHALRLPEQKVPPEATAGKGGVHTCSGPRGESNPWVNHWERRPKWRTASVLLPEIIHLAASACFFFCFPVCSFKTKLAASVARHRIKHQLISVNCLLPESVKIKQERSGRLPIYAWVNTLKSR